jgi:hypothetical protein
MNASRAESSESSDLVRGRADDEREVPITTHPQKIPPRSLSR